MTVPQVDRQRGRYRRWLWSVSPEFFVLLFSFLLNFVWEMWQVPFFHGIADGPHWRGVLICTQAAIGDAAISLFAFWVVALAWRSRRWLLAPNRVQVVGFVVLGLAVTVVFEALATGPLERWRYNGLMPVLPVFGTGLLPLLQWLALPPLIVWLARGQLRGRHGEC